MITDGILFHDEVVLLEARVRELWSIVDQFVVVEMPLTIGGEEKGYVSESELFDSRIGPLSDKVTVVRLANIPMDPMERMARRRMATEAVLHFAKPGLPISFSEAWRIPSREALAHAEQYYPSVACLWNRSFWWSIWGRPMGHADKGSLFCSYQSATRQGLYSLWQRRLQAHMITNGGWTFRGCRHPDHVRAEFNSGDNEDLYNLTGDEVRDLIFNSKTKQGDRIIWKKPEEGDVPDWMWANRNSFLAPLFSDPRMAEEKDAVETVVNARNIKTRLEIKQ